MPDDETLRFYADNAQIYATRQRQLDQDQLDGFLAALPRAATCSNWVPAAARTQPTCCRAASP